MKIQKTVISLNIGAILARIPTLRRILTQNNLTTHIAPGLINGFSSFKSYQLSINGQTLPAGTRW